MDFTKPLTMTFEPPDLERFPALRIARQAMQCGGAAGSIFNAANEVAVQAFIEGRLTFDRIPAIVEETLNLLGPLPANTLDDILHADTLARAAAQRGIKERDMEKRGLCPAQ